MRTVKAGYQIRQAVFQRDEHRMSRATVGRGLRTGATGRHHPANHAAMRLFQFIESREGRTKAHLFGITGINTGHQRLHDPFAGMPTEPAAKEGRQRLILRRSSRRNQDVATHSGQIDPGQEPAAKNGPSWDGVKVTNPSGNSCNCPPGGRSPSFYRVSIDELIGDP